MKVKKLIWNWLVDLMIGIIETWTSRWNTKLRVNMVGKERWSIRCEFTKVKWSGRDRGEKVFWGENSIGKCDSLWDFEILTLLSFPLLVLQSLRRLLISFYPPQKVVNLKTMFKQNKSSSNTALNFLLLCSQSHFITLHSQLSTQSQPQYVRSSTIFSLHFPLLHLLPSSLSHIPPHLHSLPRLLL